MTQDFESAKKNKDQERNSSFLRRYDLYRKTVDQKQNQERKLTSINDQVEEDSETNAILNASAQENQLMQDILQSQDQDEALDYSLLLKFIDLDEKLYPRQQAKLKWEDLNQNYKSTERQFKEVEEVAKENSEQILDLRPYMIERPFSVILKDSITKVHMMFRQLHLRQLVVTHLDTGEIQGIITRQDLFQYMTL